MLGSSGPAKGIFPSGQKAGPKVTPAPKPSAQECCDRSVGQALVLHSLLTLLPQCALQILLMLKLYSKAVLDPPRDAPKIDALQLPINNKVVRITRLPERCNFNTSKELLFCSTTAQVG